MVPGPKMYCIVLARTLIINCPGYPVRIILSRSQDSHSRYQWLAFSSAGPRHKLPGVCNKQFHRSGFDTHRPGFWVLIKAPIG